MKFFGILACVLAVSAALYFGWLARFVATGLNNIQHDSIVQAYEAAKAQGELVGLPVRNTEGTSNSLWGDYKEGFYLLDASFPYEDIKPRMFAIYKAPDGPTINHSARVKQGDDWIMEGDGNRGSDPILMTAKNYIGVVHENTVWRY